MPFTPELMEELNALSRFDPDSDRQGLKVHSTAEAGLIAAMQRLHVKGLVTQADGGYLTPLGREAASHVQALSGLLTTGGATAAVDRQIS